LNDDISYYRISKVYLYILTLMKFEEYVFIGLKRLIQFNHRSYNVSFQTEFYPIRSLHVSEPS